MPIEKLTHLELFAASSWLAGIPLNDVVVRVSERTFKTFRRIYTQLDTATDVCELVDKRKER